MHTEYRKLVRDLIPEIIRQDGYDCNTDVLNEDEYHTALREKLIEEALEAASAADNQHLLTELADLYEVMDTLMQQYDINETLVRAEQEKRREERGGFQQRIRLLNISSLAKE